MFRKYKLFIAFLSVMLSGAVIAEGLDFGTVPAAQIEDIVIVDFVLEDELIVSSKFKDFVTCLRICKKEFPKQTDPGRAACVRNCEKVLPGK